MTSSGRNGNGKCWLSETFIQKDRIPGTAPTSSHLEYFKIFEESHMHGIHFNVQRTLEITYFFFSKRKANSRKGKMHITKSSENAGGKICLQPPASAPC